MQIHSNRLGHALLAGAALTIITLAWSVSTSAHHGWGGYVDQTTEISGTVESPVAFSGAHASMKLRSQGEVWDIVLAPPGRTAASGLKEGIIPVGAEVTLRGNRHRDPKRFEFKASRLTWNGRTFDIYPERS